MKTTLLTGILILVCAISFAQNRKEKKAIISIGGEAAYPLRRNNYNKGVDFGVSIQPEFLIKKMGVTVNFGYSTTEHASREIEKQLWLMAGARYYFSRHLFAAGQLGPTLVGGNDFAGAAFIASPSVGAKFNPLDISLQYRATVIPDASFSAIGLRVALYF